MVQRELREDRISVTVATPPTGMDKLARLNFDHSYAVYLVHKPVFMVLRPQLLSRGIDPGAPLTIVAVMAAGIAGGWLLYRLVETPFMRLRARWYPADGAKVEARHFQPAARSAAEPVSSGGTAS